MITIARYCSFGVVGVAAAMMVACGAGTGALGSPGVGPSIATAQAAHVPVAQAMTAPEKRKHRNKGELRIKIKIPPKYLHLPPGYSVSLPVGGSSQRHTIRKPKYVSPSTQSMTVATSAGGQAQTFNLTAKSSHCSVDSTTGYLTCTESAFFPVGAQTITITLYDGQNGTGSALSSGSTNATIVVGQVNTISVTLDGIVATATVQIDNELSVDIPEGTPTSLPVEVSAYDADHNLVLAPGHYASTTPVTLADSDTSGATTLSTSSVSAPGAAITVGYDGGSISSATITPSVNGTAQPAGAATLTLVSAGPTIAEYTVPTGSSAPKGITAGPDGALWFTEYNGDKIGRITTGGSVTEYLVSTPGPYGSLPTGIAAGSDGALWFTQAPPYGISEIGRITTGGSITEYSLPDTSGWPFGIAAGPDRALWFTEFLGNAIGRITTSGTITEYSVPTGSSEPRGITPGPNGALWFTEWDGNKIGRITTSGTITEYSVPTSGSKPTSIAAGPDGALWFTECNVNKIGRITTSGTITEYSIPPTSGAESNEPNTITAGPNGVLWFTEQGSNQIAQITTGGTITEYSVPTSASQPFGIAAGLGGNLWFTELSANQIGEVVLSGSPAGIRTRIQSAVHPRSSLSSTR